MAVQNNSKTELEKVQKDSILSPIGGGIPSDVLEALLADKRSFGTKKSYEKSLTYFFDFAYGEKPSEKVVSQFLQLGKFDAVRIVLKYKCDLIAKGLAEGTVNCRLSALRSLVAFAAKIGRCKWTLDDVKSEPVKHYRDTSGVSPDEIGKMLAVCDRKTIKGKRDYAILRLLWTNALRRNEVASLNIGDFNYQERSLKILGKGHGSQQTIISLDIETVVSIREWLSCDDTRDPRALYPNRALFRALDNGHVGHRLTGAAIYQLVSDASKLSGVKKRMSPHKIRHSAITAALDATDGNVREVQKLSRHKKLDTLMIYDDNRTNIQRQVSELLGNILDG